MSSEENTPVDRLSPFEAILHTVNQTRDVQLMMYEELKSYRSEVQGYRLEAQFLQHRIRIPMAICILCTMLCLVSVALRFV